MAQPANPSNSTESTAHGTPRNNISSTPKAVPPANISLPRWRMRREPSATPKAPIVAPTPTEEIRMPYPPAPRCSTLRANTGIMVM